jgi:hypothetical protein
MMGEGVSPRQAHIIDFLKHPTSYAPGLPQGPAIDYSWARWTAQEIIDLAGLDCGRASCLADLRVLRDLDSVMGGSTWRYKHAYEDASPF